MNYSHSNLRQIVILAFLLVAGRSLADQPVVQSLTNLVFDPPAILADSADGFTRTNFDMAIELERDRVATNRPLGGRLLQLAGPMPEGDFVSFRACWFGELTIRLSKVDGHSGVFDALVTSQYSAQPSYLILGSEDSSGQMAPVSSVQEFVALFRNPDSLNKIVTLSLAGPGIFTNVVTFNEGAGVEHTNTPKLIDVISFGAPLEKTEVESRQEGDSTVVRLILKSPECDVTIDPRPTPRRVVRIKKVGN